MFSATLRRIASVNAATRSSVLAAPKVNAVPAFQAMMYRTPGSVNTRTRSDLGGTHASPRTATTSTRGSSGQGDARTTSSSGSTRGNPRATSTSMPSGIRIVSRADQAEDMESGMRSTSATGRRSRASTASSGGRQSATQTTSSRGNAAGSSESGQARSTSRSRSVRGSTSTRSRSQSRAEMPVAGTTTININTSPYLGQFRGITFHNATIKPKAEQKSTPNSGPEQVSQKPTSGVTGMGSMNTGKSTTNVGGGPSGVSYTQTSSTAERVGGSMGKNTDSTMVSHRRVKEDAVIDGSKPYKPSDRQSSSTSSQNQNQHGGVSSTTDGRTTR